MHSKEFESLGLMPACLDALAHEGYEKPTPIQTASIPSLLAGRDLLGCAQTGTGKTAAFALPIIQRLHQAPKKRQPRMARSLIVAPTRELAMQIDQSFAAYGRGVELKRACVYGGVGKVPQIKAMERGVDVLVATPGRLLDLKGEGALDLSAVEIVVLDEADRMLDMGFIHDVKKIIALLPAKRQTLLFSATMPSEIEELARKLLSDPVKVSIEPEKPTIDLIAQSLYYVEKGYKRDLLAKLIVSLGVTRAVVFSRTKHGADRIAKSLHIAGIEAGVIHANKGQGNRTRTMEAFRSGATPILVATDLAARGIDVDDVSHVFNFDLPTEPETYVHRIGRTARAGASGFAVTFCDTEEKRLLKQVERLLNKPIPVVKEHPYAGVRADPNAEPEDDRPPRDFSRGGPRGGNGGARGGRELRGGQRGDRGSGAPNAAGSPLSGRGAGGRGPSAGNGPGRGGQAGRGGRQASARPAGGQGTPARGQGQAREDGRASAPSQSGGGSRAAPDRRPPAHRDGGDGRPAYASPSKPSRDVRSIIDDITGRNS